jgi:hypothetical protein
MVSFFAKYAGSARLGAGPVEVAPVESFRRDVEAAVVIPEQLYPVRSLCCRRRRGDRREDLHAEPWPPARTITRSPGDRP